ncbi:MAG: DUF1131 family protein [Rhodobiaceae bacterium]|nr:DUF1131 family protein [Rhodobiaceae bacterium]
MPFLSWVLGLAGLLALASCAATTQTETTSDTAFSPSNAVFAISENAAGPITPQTPYSVETLKGLFPGFSFDTVQTMTNGTVTYLLTGFDKDGFQAFQVEPAPGRKSIASVQVVGPAGEGPHGETIGMTFVEASGRRMDCNAGSGDWTGLAICTRGHSNIHYIFAPEAYLGPSGKLPTGDDLLNAHLVRIVWRPK